MGNRAVVTSVGTDKNRVGLYLHWNGGPESVLAFCECAKQLKLRAPCGDDSYAFARLAQLVGNYFKGTLSLGVGPIKHLDTANGDNGVYEINRKWEIERRSHEGPKTVAELEDETKKYEEILADCLAINGPIFKKGGTD